MKAYKFLPSESDIDDHKVGLHLQPKSEQCGKVGHFTAFKSHGMASSCQAYIVYAHTLVFKHQKVYTIVKYIVY